MRHRGIDRIESWTARQRIVGVKAVSFEEYCLKEAFGGPPALPESLLLQAAIDLTGWLVMLSTEFTSLWLADELGRAVFANPLRPGGRARMSATVVAWNADALVCQVDATADGTPLLTSGPWQGRIVPLADFRNPDDMRVLYSEIAAPGAGG